MEECCRERVESLVYECRAVVEGMDRDLARAAIGERSLRQARGDLGDLGLHTLNDLQWVLAIANHDDTADGFGTRVV